MNKNKFIIQANNIVEDFIRRTKNEKNSTVFKENTVLRNFFIKIFTILVILSFALSIAYFALFLLLI